MKHKWLVGLVLLASGIGAAQARTNLSIAVGVPLGVVAYDNYYYAPPPPPPPVYYRERVYYEPRPVYYAPARVDVRYYHGRNDHRYCDHGRGYDRHYGHDHDRRHDDRDGWVGRSRSYRD